MRPVKRATAACVACALSVSVLGSACGGSSGNAGNGDSFDAAPALDAGSSDGGGTADASASDASTYPAFKPDIGLIVKGPGPVLTAPKIVSVVWTADPAYKTYETFCDSIGKSAYWKTALTEYGVGPAVSGGHVEITDAPPASFDVATANDEILAFVKKGVQGAPANGWPVPDDQTFYLLFIPQTVAINNNGKDDCANNVGYHVEAAIGAYPHVAYGIVAEKCHDYLPNIVDNTTETASHEIGETATDPHTETDNGWLGFDPDHYAFELWQNQQDETGDACEFYDDSYYEDPELGAWVQRLWSNAAAKAGKNPCLPAPDEAYFNVTPLATEPITTTGTTGKVHKTRGFHIPVGTEKTIDVGFYSDRPTADWTLEPMELDGITAPKTSHVSFKVDQPIGNNGKTAKVTISVNAAPAAGTQLLVTLVSSRSKTQQHYFPILIETD